MNKFFGTILLAAFASTQIHAASTGFNQTGAGPYDYNNAANWVGNTINGIWNTDLALTSTQTNTFAADTVLTTGLTFNYSNNFALRLQAAAPGTNTITLGGDISMNPSGGSAAIVTIGSSTNHLNINLNGVARTINVGTNSMVLQDVVTNGAITKIGPGTLNLSGKNNYDGVTTISNGIVTVSDSNGLGSTNGNTLLYCTGAATNGGVIYLANGVTCPEPITISGTTEALQFSAAITTLANSTSILSGPITLSGTSTIRIGQGANSTLTFNGPIARDLSNVGTLSLRVSSTGNISVNNTVNLNGGALNIVGNNIALGVATLGTNGNNVGAAQISGSAILRLGANNALATNKDLTLGTGGSSAGSDIGCLDLAGHDQIVNGLTGTPNTSNIATDSSRYVTNSAASGTNTLTIGGAATFKGVIVDGANAKVALTKTGSGTETLNSPCAYSGPTTITGGTLALAAGSSLSANTSVSIGQGGTFDVSALTTGSATYTFTPASLSASGAGTTAGTTAARIVGTAGGTINILSNTPIALTWSGGSSGTINGTQSLVVANCTLNLNTNSFTNQFTVVVPGAALTAGNYQLINATISGSFNPKPLYTGGNGVAPGYTGYIANYGSIYLTVYTNSYTLTYHAGTGGSISGTTPQTVLYLTSGTAVTAVASNGYAFSSWSDGVLTATRTDTALVGGTNVTANFVASAPSPTHLTNSVVNGNQLVLDWPTGQGWVLQSNSVSLTDTNSWFSVTGATPPFTNNVNPAQPTVFYRLKY